MRVLLDALNPAPKPSDTVIIQNIFYTLDGVRVDDPPPQYIAVYAISSNKPTGGGNMNFSGGGGGGGSMGGSGSMTEAEEEASLATTLIASVVPTDEVLISITVDELDILTLHVGDSALVTIDALPEHSFQGVVTGVNTGLTNSGGNSKYTAEVTVPRSDNMLAGMNASCLVTIETFKGVLNVPAAALCDEAGGTVVYTGVDKDGFTLTGPVAVETGLSDGTNVEILSGLNEGDTIWYSTYDTPEYTVPSGSSRGSGFSLMGGGLGSGPRI